MATVKLQDIRVGSPIWLPPFDNGEELLPRERAVVLDVKVIKGGTRLAIVEVAEPTDEGDDCLRELVLDQPAYETWGPLANYPGWRRAVLLIQLDMGAGYCEDCWLRAVETSFARLPKKFSKRDLAEADQWLSGLSQAGIETLCEGDYDEAKALLRKAKHGKLIDYTLNYVFEDMDLDELGIQRQEPNYG